MTPGFVGADPERLDAIGQQIVAHAQTLDELRATLTAQLYEAGWVGDDALASQSEWESQHAGAMARAAALLRHIGDTLRANAAQQREASAADGTDQPPTVTKIPHTGVMTFGIVDPDVEQTLGTNDPDVEQTLGTNEPDGEGVLGTSGPDGEGVLGTSGPDGEGVLGTSGPSDGGGGSGDRLG